jgi:hypothetical protein
VKGQQMQEKWGNNRRVVEGKFQDRSIFGGVVVPRRIQIKGVRVFTPNASLKKQSTAK